MKPKERHCIECGECIKDDNHLWKSYRFYLCTCCYRELHDKKYPNYGKYPKIEHQFGGTSGSMDCPGSYQEIAVKILEDVQLHE